MVILVDVQQIADNTGTVLYVLKLNTMQQALQLKKKHYATKLPNCLLSFFFRGGGVYVLNPF